MLCKQVLRTDLTHVAKECLHARHYSPHVLCSASRIPLIYKHSNVDSHNFVCLRTKVTQ
jgi:hypothetical protein